MRQALELAEKGMGLASPNPMVGAVIVRDGKVIAGGWHKKYGGLHAEREAFAYCDSSGIDCRGADMYVTLEPCCHHGHQPPCTDAVIEHGIKRVFIGSSDPNPLVAGKGVKMLREHGIEVTEGILKDECDALNEIFFKYITTGLPFVTLKYAMTADGKIACHNGLSKWITGEEARLNVQRERLRHSAVMVGIGTVLADDPMLNCRLKNGRDPVRVICDTNLRIPTDCNIVRTAGEIRTIIACSQDASEKARVLEDKGCEIMLLPEKDGHTDISALMARLGEMKTDSVLIEGGGELGWSALKAGAVDKVQTYIAPKIFGGAFAKTPVGGAGVDSPDAAFMLEDVKTRFIGSDILIESRVRKCLQE